MTFRVRSNPTGKTALRREQTPKRAVLAALQNNPDFSQLAVLSRLTTREAQKLIRWLDESGIALLFLQQLQSHGVTRLIPSEFQFALEERQIRNTQRFEDMQNEFRQIQKAFEIHKVFAVTMKGFSLFPDFCQSLALRHTTDFDFLLSPDHIERASDALRTCGYATQKLSKTDESCFTTPLLHVPTDRDDLYAKQRHRQVDLHTSVSENHSWLSIEVPKDCLAHAKIQTVNGFSFFQLSLEDKFLTQVLHAFRHSFRSWVRLSWLFEISHCITMHRDNHSLWGRVIARAGTSSLVKRVFALTLGIANRLFNTEIPETLHAWSRDALTPSICVWLDSFSVTWAISDWPGSLSNLFLTNDFIAEPELRKQYLKSRLLPRREQSSMGSLAKPARHLTLLMHAAQLRYLARRATVHLSDIVRLLLQQILWKRALKCASNRALESELKFPLGHREVS